jgi:fermentation-respiration switch protein FrsA (DUF1100 family)
VIWAIRQCTQLQIEAIKRFEPDVVLGSSFGGAIAVLCTTQGFWSGPTLLLAPAQARLSLASLVAVVPSFASIPGNTGSAAAGSADAAQKLQNQAMPSVLVVHGSRDTVVPLADSEALVNSAPLGMHCRLEVVDDIHPLHTVGTTALMKQWVDETVAMSREAEDEAEEEASSKSGEPSSKGGSMGHKQLEDSFSALMQGLNPE